MDETSAQTEHSRTTGSGLSELEKRVLNLIQWGFPLVSDPYAAVGERLGVRRERVHAAVQRLRDSGVIRRIGASFIPARLGYVSALVAARVDAPALPRAAARAAEFAEVTHNYERDDRFNLWFTIIAEGEQRMADIVAAVAAVPGVRQVELLPAVTTFKTRVDFKLT